MIKSINFKKAFPASNPGNQELASELHRLISAILPNAVISQNEDYVGYGLGSAASLDDPHHLVSGKGKVHRYVKLQDIEQVQSQEIMDLMEQALQAAQKKYGER